jgi:hypothetical protein
MALLFSAASHYDYKLLCITKHIPKKFCLLPFARGANQRFHVIQIALQRTPSGRRQPVFRFGQAPVEGLGAHDVVGFFEFARMNAQVAVGSLQHSLQLVKRKRPINRQCADDAQPHPLVNQTVEISGDGLARLARSVRQ